MSNAVEKLDMINRTLERQNDIMREMLEMMPKPEGKFTRMLEIAVLVAAVLGILSTVDVVRSWIIGG